MLLMRIYFHLLILYSIAPQPQFNFHYTDFVSEHEANNGLQHDCLRVLVPVDEKSRSRQVLTYCLNEKPSTFRIEPSSIANLTFEQMSKQNITSEQLYRWSAPIDLIEHYQSYLDQSTLTPNGMSIDQDIFYNCTLPMFGPMCQYELDGFNEDYSSLFELVTDYYLKYEYNSKNLTCYTHLQCNRGPSPACLDWTEICNGQIDCLDGDVDEQDCWKLELNECKPDEYRCANGQCIPESFFRDDLSVPDCIDGTDERPASRENSDECNTLVPSFKCEDRTCRYLFSTSSCLFQRQDILLKAFYSTKDDSISEECWTVFKCIIKVPDHDDESCEKICYMGACADTILKTCPDMFYIPVFPMMLGNIYFAHEKTDALSLAYETIQVPYLCYNDSGYDEFFMNETKLLFHNSTCVRPSNQAYAYIMSVNWYTNYELTLGHIQQTLRSYQLLGNYSSEICNKSNMYQCMNSSKCISLSRLKNSEADCPRGDDEGLPQDLFESLVKDLKAYFKCELSNKYIPKSFFDDTLCECSIPYYDLCEDEEPDILYAKKNISFQTTCDNFIELLPITINGQNHTDETECEQWYCNNIYSHCDGIWNCPNGQDEIGCHRFPTINCSSNHHLCVSPETNQLMCLPITKAHDGHVDCLGGTDEPQLCQKEYQTHILGNFYCRNTTAETCKRTYDLCDNRPDCPFEDDEQFCQKNLSTLCTGNVCYEECQSHQSGVEKFLCQAATDKKKSMIKHFFLSGMEDTNEKPQALSVNRESTKIFKTHIIRQHEHHCHRGIELRLWLNRKTNATRTVCLCPPSFYGDQCQHQNQRVSLTVQFRALSDSWSTVFAIIISLIDDSDERMVHSHEQLIYLSAKDCKIKYNVYLLYSTRPRNSTKNYAIHMDIYEKLSLKYRGSLLFPVQFPFLPVYRHAAIIDIPRSHENLQICSSLQCVQGKCVKYTNDVKGKSFCQCYRGWHGRLCNVAYVSKCSSDSVSLGITPSNRSICVCPTDKFGPRCLLSYPTSHSSNTSQCLNGGQWILVDEYTISTQIFRCICPKGYSGDRCELIDTKIVLSFSNDVFSNDVLRSQSIFVHFIRIMVTSRPIRTTTLRAILPTKDSIDIYWSQPFHLAFVEFTNKIYHLAVIQESYQPSSVIRKQINAANRCQNISELFNATFLQMHIVRRIKYYHLPCQTYSSNLTCFYDDIHLCLCYNFNQHRLANCFEFNHNMPSDCLGQSACENGGQCFQDTPDCPQRSVCICPQCFYGTRCQFSTTGFGLSLDGILGYHILPHVGFTHQTTIVKVSFTITLIFMIVGYVNGFLALITFKNKALRDVGCGWYLLGSSITTLLSTTVFILKFWILLLGQMAILSNRSFLYIQCLTLDFLLRVGLSLDQWFNACVALERAVTVIKAGRFQRQKSKQVAKFVIIILPIIVTGSLIYDPVYRQLIEEENEDEKRIWCSVSYPSGVQVLNSFINPFHFIAPFVINLVSAIIIIFKRSRQQQYAQTHRAYEELLKEQLQQNKRLFVAPIVLVILALPRLIISFISKCMKSTNEAYLFLIGYFISFIPSMLTFVIFVLPSQFYKDQCRKTLIAYRTKIQRRFQQLS